MRFTRDRKNRWFVLAAVVAAALAAAVPARAQDVPFETAVAGLRSPDASARIRSLVLLRQAGYLEAAAAVAPLLADPDPTVQGAAVETALTLYLVDVDYTVEVGRTIVKEKGVTLPLYAFVQGPGATIANPALPEIVRGLLTAMGSSTPTVRFDAAYTLAVLGRPLILKGLLPDATKMIDSLIAILRESNPVMKEAATNALGRLLGAALQRGNLGADFESIRTEAGDLIVGGLNEADQHLRLASMNALGEMRYDRAVQSLTGPLQLLQEGPRGDGGIRRRVEDRPSRQHPRVPGAGRQRRRPGAPDGGRRHRPHGRHRGDRPDADESRARSVGVRGPRPRVRQGAQRRLQRDAEARAGLQVLVAGHADVQLPGRAGPGRRAGAGGVLDERRSEGPRRRGRDARHHRRPDVAAACSMCCCATRPRRWPRPRRDRRSAWCRARAPPAACRERGAPRPAACCRARSTSDRRSTSPAICSARCWCTARPTASAAGTIVETEAYVGEADPACHAAPGPTRRNEPLYGEPGRAYVYFNYGMHCLVNAVTERRGFPAAVLVRALEPVDGVGADAGAARAGPHGARAHDLCRGPGNLTRALGITLAENRLDLTRVPASGHALWIEDRGIEVGGIVWTPRVGIRVGTDRAWRCFVRDSAAFRGGAGRIDRSKKPEGPPDDCQKPEVSKLRHTVQSIPSGFGLLASSCFCLLLSRRPLPHRHDRHAELDLPPVAIGADGDRAADRRVRDEPQQLADVVHRLAVERHDHVARAGCRRRRPCESRVIRSTSTPFVGGHARVAARAAS